MVEHKCSRCNNIFLKKSLYTEHIKKKKKCNDIQYNKQCSYCAKIFTTKSSVTRHIKNSCKIYKKQKKIKG